MRHEIYKDGKLIQTIGNPSLEEEKELYITQAKKLVGRNLKDTDWYVIRKYDSGQAIPTEVQDYRDAVRALMDIIELEIEDIESIEELSRYARLQELRKL